ncbi:hypothetical protein BpHYR1_026385 [Brachionus plicatilis]|uniref:Uncharacterized protein n=1 Tax=Brachionus plicatilis TaxID=10195 RepID=A0A3M7SVM4_BRAPC|nr:hypothetical protein BpHYR1_026385 [Brachionus plicatilis]
MIDVEGLECIMNILCYHVDHAPNLIYLFCFNYKCIRRNVNSLKEGYGNFIKIRLITDFFFKFYMPNKRSAYKYKFRYFKYTVRLSQDYTKVN